jgi:hypothetical protein
MHADEIDLKWKKVELANLRKNRDCCDPEMWPTIDARIFELENFIANFRLERKKIQLVEMK